MRYLVLPNILRNSRSTTKVMDSRFVRPALSVPSGVYSSPTNPMQFLSNTPLSSSMTSSASSLTNNPGDTKNDAVASSMSSTNSTLSSPSSSPSSSSTSSPLLSATPTDTTSTRSYSTTAAAEQGMKDEYGVMDDSGQTFVYDGDFVLENGRVLPQAQLRYQTYGELNVHRDNVIVVCHALTGNASLHSWWGGLLGPGLAFDTSKYFIVCCNILGSCYGSTGPMSINPSTQQPYGIDFPDISVQDTVRLQLTMLREGPLQVSSVKCVIGGSFGGMQALEYAVLGGSSKHATFRDANGNHFVRSVVPIACGAAHTAWQIAISEVQRQAIYKDPQWVQGNYTKATAGLEVARQIGMVSYRTARGYVSKFGRRKQRSEQDDSARDLQNNKHKNESSKDAVAEYGSSAKWQVKSYLEYQGQKFLTRFDPVTYIKMTEQMDSHDIARGRDESTDAVLNTIDIPALVMGIDSDVLYPLAEQEHLAQHMPKSEFKIIRGDDGHDGFLLEQEQVGGHIIDFLKRHK